MIVLRNGKEQIIVNEFDHFYFEAYIERKDYSGCEGEDCPSESAEEKVKWEEQFSSHTYHYDNGPSSVGLDFTFVDNAFVYGIPEHASSLALKNTVNDEENGYNEPYRLWNLDVFEYKLDVPDSLYGCIPFVVGYSEETEHSVFWMNAAETYIDIEESHSKNGKNVRWMSESGVIEAFILLSTASSDAAYLSQYYELTGFPQLPSPFALGHHQCRWNYNDVDDVKQISDKFDEYDIPSDVIWLDIEHTDGKRYFTWDKHKFDGAKSMIDYVSSSGRKMVTIVDPHIKKDESYFVYKKINDLDLWVKNRDNDAYHGWCWPGDSRYPDFANRKMRKLWAEQFRFENYEQSTKDLFIWNDMNEPSVFDGPEVSMPISNIHSIGPNDQRVKHNEIHNIYGYFVHEATFNGLLLRSNYKQRPFVLSRSFFAGSQKYGAIWTGDNTANWEHLKISVPMLLSLSVSGLPFVGADVGGFFNNPNGELMARWYELAAYYPFFRNHAHQETERRELWKFEDVFAQRMKHSILARYRIMPYVYTLFYQSSKFGELIMRPLWYGPFRSDKATYGNEKAFMFGNAFFIQPIVEAGIDEVDVTLPQNKENNAIFYEMDGNKLNVYESGKHHLTGYGARIPVLRYGGTVTVEKHRIRRSASLMKYDPVTIIVALDSNGSAIGHHYMDDEESLNGQHIFTKLECQMTNKEGTLTNSIVSQSDELESVPRIEVERIVVIGKDIGKRNITEIAIEQMTKIKKTKQFGFLSYTLAIRKPNIFINEPFVLTFH